ncbi:hypothetical protein A2U01_0106749, partial [Trifolium medium]|nr:hypothetical protein [Trifolium medium]
MAPGARKSKICCHVSFVAAPGANLMAPEAKFPVSDPFD